ncbi:MAG: DNA topoisomerase [Lachnospiraceae bacterium]|nr:DNA topoisomerase [Lachnospiraceae bacterium]
MAKPLFIAEKPSVAAEFAKALKMNTKRYDGYVESENGVVTWCVGHLVTMSYPEKYDERLKRWSLDTLPFIPEKFLYEVIPGVEKQFNIVKNLLHREDVDCIYVCTDSGREGEYIYRLVEQMAGVNGKQRKRVWIDSQTEEEILRGVKDAKDLSEYDHLSEAAYLRAKEDYLMGINFSRLLTLKYGRCLSGYLKTDRTVISVGRVMTCVLGMIVRREREIRAFVKTPFYRVLASSEAEGIKFDAEWKVSDQSKYAGTPYLYKENGFKEKAKAEELKNLLEQNAQGILTIEKIERKKELKNPPLLFNLAELQNECSKLFKISPDETLKIIQELYEKKLVTYPRTDARVLSTAVAKEIHRNISGLKNLQEFSAFAEDILEKGTYKGIAKTRYVNDKQITDHYAIIPTGQGLGALRALNPTSGKVYQVIVRRFLSIFYPPAVYQKVSILCTAPSDQKPDSEEYYQEQFSANFKVLVEEGYLKVQQSLKKPEEESVNIDINTIEQLKKFKKGDKLSLNELNIKEGETSPPKRYNSGSIILAMENAGQLIEDEELRAQIKGSGIGTSATRAEILKKLINIQYINLNKKTQIITPSQLGEMVHDVVNCSIRPLLNPELTASWEKGLTYVAEGTITSEEYMQKLDDFVSRRVNGVRNLNNQPQLRVLFDQIAVNYK